MHKEVEDCAPGLDLIDALKPRQFKLHKGDDATIYMGFIGNETRKVMKPDYLSLALCSDEIVNDTELFAPLVKAIQELSTRLTAAEADIQRQQHEITRLNELIPSEE